MNTEPKVMNLNATLKQMLGITKITPEGQSAEKLSQSKISNLLSGKFGDSAIDTK